MSTSVGNLLEILGPSVSRAHAEKLLADAEGDAATAVALHFSALTSNPPPPSGGNSGSSRELRELRSVLGSQPLDGQLTELLRMSCGSIQAAIELYLDNPRAGMLPPSRGGPGGSAAGGAALASNRQTAAASAAAAGTRTAPAAAAASGNVADSDGGARVLDVGGGAGAGGQAAGGGPNGGHPQGPGAAASPRLAAAANGSAAPAPALTAAAPQRSSHGLQHTASTHALPATYRVHGTATAGTAVGGHGLGGEVAGPAGASGAGGAPAAGQAQPPPPPPPQGPRPAPRPPGPLPSSVQPRQLLDGDMLNRVKHTQGPYPLTPLLPLPKFRRRNGTLHLTDESPVPDRTPPHKPLSQLQWPMRLGAVTVPLECDWGGLLTAMPANGGAVVPPRDKKGRALLNTALKWIEKGKLRLPGYRKGEVSQIESEVHCGVEWATPRSALSSLSFFQPRLVLTVSNPRFRKMVEKEFPGVLAQQRPVKLRLRSEEEEVRVAVSAMNGLLHDFLESFTRKFDGNGSDVLTRSEARGLMVNIRIFGPGLDPVNGQVIKMDLKPAEIAAAAVNKQKEGKGKEAAGEVAAAGDKNKRRKSKEAEEETEEGNSQRHRKRTKTAMSEDEGNDDASKATKARSSKCKSLSKQPNSAIAGGPSTTTTTQAAVSRDASATTPTLSSGKFHLQLEFFLDESGLKTTAPSDYFGETGYGSPRGGKSSKYQKKDTQVLANVIDLLLRHGSGLFVGPDCDGAINTGDVEGPEVLHGPAAAAGPSSGSAAAGPSNPPADPAAGTSSAAAAGSAAGGTGGGAAEAGGASTSDDEDGGTHNLDALLDAIQPPADLPQAVAPTGIKTHPKPFQLQGLEWLLRRERRGDAIGRSLLLLHPAWAQVVVGSSGLLLHVHRIAPHYVTPDFIPSPVGGTCGGFLCDEMGLGKSLQTLMLIAANPPPPKWPAKPVRLPGVFLTGIGDGGAGGGSAARGSSSGSGAGPSRSCSPSPPLGAPWTALKEPEERDEPVPIPTTLLVVPGNLQEQWMGEIKRHVSPGKLSWAVYRGYKDSPTFSSISTESTVAHLFAHAGAGIGGSGGAEPSDVRSTRRAANAARHVRSLVEAQGSAALQQQKLLPLTMARKEDGSMVPVHSCDLVLVTYEVLRSELSGVAGRMSAKMLPRLGFWRIVLDEAQLVANSNSVAAEVASSLYRRHAWVVTGTPISSNLNEVQGLCEFLSYMPYYQANVWRKLLYEPFVHRSPMGVAALRALFRGVMLRRSRAAVEDQLALPPCTREDIRVDLTAVERTFYDVQKARYLSALAAVKASGPMAAGSESAVGGFTAAGRGGRGHRGRAGSSRRGGDQEGRRTGSNAYQRALSALVELRQCCCHPHIVRRVAQAAEGQSARAAGGKKRGAGGGGGDNAEAGSAPRSYRQIMAKLVSDAYAAYDQAVANLFGARIQLAALRDYNDATKQGAEGGAGPGGSNAAAASAAAAFGPAPNAPANTPALAARLETLQQMEKLVSETDLRFQAKSRGADGAISWERARADTAAFGGVAAGRGMASVPPFLATEQARERKRRWQRLQLDVQMLRCYLACLQAPFGTMQFLASQANAVAAAESHRQAIERVKAAAAHRTSRYEEALAELNETLRGVAAMVGEDMDQAEAVSKARERVNAAARLLAQATGAKGTDSTSAAEKVATAVATATEAVYWSAVADASTPVLEAAGVVTRLHEQVNVLRKQLGMEPVDLLQADTELRRSQRQVRQAAGQQAEGAAGGGAGSAAGGAGGARAAEEAPSAPVSTRSPRQAAAAKLAYRDCNSDSGGEGTDRADGRDDDPGDSSSEEEGPQRKKRAPKVRGGKPKAAGSALEGALVALGGTPYQEALFRMEVAIRTFQRFLSSGRKDGVARLESDQLRLMQAVREKWHALQHLLNQQEEQGMADDPPPQQQQQGLPALLPPNTAAATSTAAVVAYKTDAAAAAAGGGPSGSAAAAPASAPATQAPPPVSTKEEFSCPICLDVAERRTITTCGHTYCTDCIHDIVQGKGTAPCPICRRQLTRVDLHDSVPDAETVDLDAIMPAEMPPNGAAAGEYGAKVTALLQELARMSDEDPNSKALVFSSWGRLLRLVQEALLAKGISCVSLMGGNPERRQEALNRFLNEEDCRVLLLMKSTSGGAAGLTLTVAHTAFMMEPAVNPGLEAQAAARICRLGQDRPTRVVRIIARDTVEDRVLALQQHKQQLGEELPTGGEAGSEAVDGSVLVRFFDNL